MTFAKNKLLDFLLGATFVCAIVVCITSLFPYFARKWWFFDLFSHFRVQMMLCLVLASVLLLFSTVKKTIGIFLLFIALHLVEIVPLYLEPSGLASTDKSNLSICLLNVNSSTGDPQKVLAYLQTVESDIIIIQEYSSRWTQPLEALKVRYPYQIEDIREDNFGMALLSKQEFLSEEVFFFTDEVLPSLGIELLVQSRKVFILATHPMPPYGAENTGLRNRQLTEIGNFLADSAGPVILVGDLNTTPWSPVFKDLLQATGLQNSMKGFGIQPTWPTTIPLFWIPLDHLLHSPDFHVKSRKTGPHVGSDHFPVEVRLSLGEN